MQAGTKRKHIEIKIRTVPKVEEKKKPEKPDKKSKKEKKSKKDKKGKASQDASQAPSKPASAGPSVPPFLVHFASNDVKHDEQYRLRVFKPKDPKKKQPMVLMCQQAGANLVGSTALPPQTAADKAQYVIGLYNKAKRTLTLTPAAGGSVVKLEPQAALMKDAEVAGFNRPAGRAAQQRPEDLAARRLEAKRLVEAFGSTRRRRQMKQREEGLVLINQNADEDRLKLIMGEVAAKAVAAGQTREEVMSRVGAARVVPVHNPKATRPEDAYRISAMFHPQLLSAVNVGQLLHAAEKQADRKDLQDKNKVPDYIISRLNLLANYPTSKEADRKRKARHLALLSALIQLATASKMLRTKPPLPASESAPGRPGGVDELANRLRIGRKDVLEQLLDKFSEKGMDGGVAVYNRDNYRHQLLLMHVLVVALDVEGWSMAPQQFDGLREALKMTAADLVSRFRELGCSCAAAKLMTGDNTAVTSYTVRLLPDGVKTLEQCFPRQKGPPKQRGR